MAYGTLPAQISAGVTAASANPRVPISRTEQNIAYMNDAQCKLRTAFSSVVQGAGGLPRDRLTGQLYGNNGQIVGTAASEARFAGLPAFDFATQVGGVDPTAFSSPAGSMRQSFWYTVVIAGDDLNAYIMSGSGQGPGASISGSNIIFTASQAGGGGSLVVPKSRLSTTTANIIFVSGDAVTRQLAVYINSLTPNLSATGIGLATWPDPGETGFYRFGALGGVTPMRGRMLCGAAGEGSLYHASGGPARIKELISAAAKDFGITLV